jgi:hypothetical protein
MHLLDTLRDRNEALFYYGWLTMIGGVVCFILSLVTQNQVMGISAYIKPMKFFLSIWIYSWTMGYILYYLQSSTQVKLYTWVTIMAFSYELLIITYQAARGQLSHFNVSTPANAALFTSMGIIIVIQSLWTVFIAYLFFTQKSFTIPDTLVWGIRLGIVLSVIFAFEGGVMGAMLRHTVGAPDGGAGLPLLNWSKEHGDLRVAHFIGIHALQIVPLLSYYIATKPSHVFAIATIYFVLVTGTMIQALLDKPLF